MNLKPFLATIGLTILFLNGNAQNNCPNTWTKEISYDQGNLITLYSASAIDKDENITHGFNFLGNFSSDQFTLESPHGNSFTHIGLFTFNSSGQTTAAFQSESRGCNLTAQAFDPDGNLLVLASFYDSTITIQGQKIQNVGSNSTLLLQLDKSGSLTNHQILAYNLDGNSFVHTMKFLSDDEGNLYFAGRFGGNCNLFGQTFSTSDYDVFVAKLNADRTLAWVVHGGEALSMWVHSLTLDQNKNLLVTISFTGDLYFENMTIPAKNELLVGNMGLLKFSNNGILLWGKSGGYQKAVNAGHVITDSGNNIYFTGNMSNTFVFDTDTITRQGSQNFYLIKTNEHGDLLWSKTFSNNGFFPPSYYISILPDNSVALSGTFNDSLQLYNHTLVDPSGKVAMRSHAYLAFIDPHGNLKHYEHFTSSKRVSINKTFALKSGELYVMGFYEDNANLGDYQLNQNGLNQYIYRYCKQGLVSNVKSNTQNPSLQLQLFPNPARQQLNVQWTVSGKVEIIVRDLQGRILTRTSAEGDQYNLTLEHLVAGFYLLEVVYSDGMKHTGKFIKVD